MPNPDLEPKVKRGGSAFNGNFRLAKRPIPHLPNTDKTNVVSLTEFCDRNFITRYQGYKAIDKKLLIAFKMFGRWWVRSNPDCIEHLLEYLGMDELIFDEIKSTYDGRNYEEIAGKIIDHLKNVINKLEQEKFLPERNKNVSS